MRYTLVLSSEASDKVYFFPRHLAKLAALSNTQDPLWDDMEQKARKHGTFLVFLYPLGSSQSLTLAAG